MEREAKGIISLKGTASETQKILDALTKEGSPLYIPQLEGKHSYDTFKVEEYRVTGNTVELTLEPNDFEYIDVFRQVENAQVLESFAALFSSLVKAFPSVSFFIAIKVAIDEIYDYGGGYFCAYTAVENGAETEKEHWVWETTAYQNDDEDEWIDECEHYSRICNFRYEFIEKKRDLFLLEDGKDPARKEAEKALAEAAKKAEEADEPYPADDGYED
jgi:hypothetical protein